MDTKKILERQNTIENIIGTIILLAVGICVVVDGGRLIPDLDRSDLDYTDFSNIVVTIIGLLESMVAVINLRLAGGLLRNNNTLQLFCAISIAISGVWLFAYYVNFSVT